MNAARITTSIRPLTLCLMGTSGLFGEPLTFDTTPLGEKERPLILRTYVPDPGLAPGVFPNHGKASKFPKYNPSQGRDVKGEYSMIKVIPGAIAVNHGPALSYVWDTAECRLLYALLIGSMPMSRHAEGDLIILGVNRQSPF